MNKERREEEGAKEGSRKKGTRTWPGNKGVAIGYSSIHGEIKHVELQNKYGERAKDRGSGAFGEHFLRRTSWADGGRSVHLRVKLRSIELSPSHRVLCA